ncbi:hypothetical protein AAES_43190 [Amazona aestiva]|uniref:Fibronectin type-III domain-containing protein n=1 Tax=Amazona aestiva TaxID=12930 RepID=A0A0Q3TWG4_AMAAE|nr:hypothetical protein AAES_43190 [Amazona aestiva]
MLYVLLPPSSRSFTLRDLAAGREYELCVAALQGAGGSAPPVTHPLGCVRFSTAPAGSASPPGCAALPRAHFLGGTVIIVIGAAIAASVLLFILILTARYKAAAASRRLPAVTSVCSQTNGAHRSPDPEPAAPEPPAVAVPIGAPLAVGSGSHSFPRRSRTRRHGSLPRLDQGGDAAPALRPSFGSTHWMLESTV